MEKYNLEQTGQQVQNILNESTPQSELTEETERAQLAEQQLQNDIDAIEEKIPSGASSSNKLATEDYVDDSVSTATATFRGTFNLVSDLGLTVDATEQQIAAALASEISTADNNDYCFVQIPTSAETPTEIEEIDRYKFNGAAWSFEYELNNSGFTADQWNAINSHITSGDVTKLLALPTNAELNILLNGKQDVLTFDNVPTENSNNPVKSGGVKSAIDDEKGARINSDTALQQAIDGINGKIPSDASSENKLATASDVDDEATARSNADQSLQDAIEAILLLIPTAASSLNQLADKAFVNSSIATNTATFRGTFNLVNDLHLTLAATHAQVGNALALAIQESDNNDYAFVQIPTVETAPNEIAQTDRYKFNGSTWEYEYTLNNSGFTSAQWIAINSGITSVLVTKLSALPTNSELTSELGALTTAINNINLKIPAAAAQNNKLVDTAALEAYIIQVLDVLTVTYNVTSSDGHVTFHIAQTDGKITAVTLTTNDIASANDLTVLAGRVTTAENDIDSLEFRVGTNEADIALLQAAYAGLTQSDIIIGALPASGVANKIYRIPGTNSYSDYMWNGTQFVLMATYNNAIDPRPKKGSTNLVESGGVFDNMGALDISELNATENPHTLATYADLSAALAAIPSNDYKKGGMSIKFVQTSDNKYVQFRYMSSSTAVAYFTNVANWQGVDDEPTAGSNNLVKSSGTYDKIRHNTDVINITVLKTNILEPSSTLNGYPRTNGAFYPLTGYVSGVYDISELDKVYISGISSSVDVAALIAFSSDPSFASYTKGFLRQTGLNELMNYEVAVPEHNGTLYACILNTESGNKRYDLYSFDSYINAVKEIDKTNEDVVNIDGLLWYKKEIQGTTISGYPRTNGKISGDTYRSIVYNVSDTDTIYISGTENAPTTVLLVAFSTDPTFATFTHGYVRQPDGVSTLTDYAVPVPTHVGTLYACIPFATTAAKAELGGDIFTLVKSKTRFDAQIFNNRLKVDENRISELEDLSKVTINCIGDSITQGQGGILNLRAGTTSTWNRYESYLQQILGQEKYSVKNYGYGGNDPSSIFTSMGWEGVVINQNITLKGDKTPVAINDINALTGTSLDEVVGGYLAQFRTTEAETAQTKCSVLGIPCDISRSNNVLYLTRQDAVSYDTIIPLGTMLCFDGVLDKDGISVLFTGENNMTLYTQNNGADFVEYLKNIVSKINNGKYIIIGLHVAATQLSNINDIKTANNALRKEFGNRFIDLQKELSSYAIFQQLDYTPTDDSYFTSQQLAGGVYSDEGSIALGIQPSSFWREVKGIADYTTNDSIHMSGLGYNALAILISNRLKTLGWITE